MVVSSMQSSREDLDDDGWKSESFRTHLTGDDPLCRKIHNFPMAMLIKFHRN